MRSIIKPVKNLALAANELVTGNETVIIPAVQNQDETGEIAIALTQFRENMIQANTLRKELEFYLRDSNIQNQGDEQKYQVEETGSQIYAEETDTKVDLVKVSSPEKLSENIDMAVPITEHVLENKETRDGSNDDSKPSPLIDKTSDEKLQSSRISEASLLVAQTSVSASNAAKEAERCDLMISGLSGAMKKINDIELLLASIRDHMSLLAVQTAISNEKVSSNSDKSVIQSEKLIEDNQEQKGGEFIGENLDTLQNGTKRAIRAIRQVGQTIKEVNDVALEIASEASTDALDAATELLQQSEDLRGMLDGLLGKIRPDNATKTNG
jgi:hypothetical protein